MRQPHQQDLPGRPDLRVVAPGPRISLDSERAYWGLLAIAVLAGCLIRTTFVLGSSFPLNDGGMFYQMTLDLQRAGYALPATTTYNSVHLPFAYPPLGFYVAGAIDGFTPLSLLDVFRFLPLAVSMATILAFAGLARRLLSSRVAVVAAVFAFGLLPPTFMWMIMGGGVTRSMGLLFALLAMGQMLAVYERTSVRGIVIAALYCAGALLSHLEMAWVTMFSVAILFAAYGRNRLGVRDSLLVAGGAIALAAPWWGTIVHRDGLAPFVSAAHSGSLGLLNPILLLIQFDPTLEKLFPLLTALGLLGLIMCLRQRRFLLPAWIVATALLDARAFPTSASIPLALLAGVGIESGLMPILRLSTPISVQRPTAEPTANVRPRPAFMVGALMLLGLYALLSAAVTGPKLLSGMSTDERAAMAWTAANTPVDSRFAVISGDGWAVDRTSEWFPVVAGRQSVATVQGWEWVPGEFKKHQSTYNRLQDCENSDADCVIAWGEAQNISFDYVYLAGIPPRVPAVVHDICCLSLRNSLRTDPRFSVVYDEAGALILKRIR